MGALSIWHWLIVLLIVALVFGTNRLRSAGKDLGAAIGEFKKSSAVDLPSGSGESGAQVGAPGASEEKELQIEEAKGKDGK